MNTVLLTSRKFRIERFEPAAGDSRARPTDVVVHPGAAVILPLLDDGRVVLIRNRRIAVDAELLELPAGTLEPPEPPIECARRELQEETGYSAGQIEPLLSFYSAPGFCTERLHAFVATKLTAGAAQPEVGEAIELAPVAYDEAIAAIAAGRIIDAKTIATLLYYERFVRRGAGA